MKFSIIIPSYGRLEVLSKCLEHINQSRYRDFEIIIVNDGFKGFRLLQEFDHLSLHVHPFDQRKGPAEARNHGAEKSTGEVLLFLDSDVYIKEDTLDQIQTIFKEDKGIDVVQCVYNETCLHVNLGSQFKHFKQVMRISSLTGQDYVIGTSCLAIKKERFLATKGFPVEKEYEGCEDRMFGAELARLGYRIFLAHHIAVDHDRFISLGSLIKLDFRRTISEMHLLVKGDHFKKLVKGKSYVKASEIVALFLAPVQIVLIGLQQFPFYFMAFLLYLFMNRSFLKFWMRYNKNILGQYSIMLIDDFIVFLTLGFYGPFVFVKSLLEKKR